MLYITTGKCLVECFTGHAAVTWLFIMIANVNMALEHFSGHLGFGLLLVSAHSFAKITPVHVFWHTVLM